LLSRTAGLTLHWFAGVPIHDATNNFKLYSRRFLDATTIESEAGFELALELSVKATLQRRRLAEVPTTWRDRTGGDGAVSGSGGGSRITSVRGIAPRWLRAG
jgi:dolichol-phosphate mannosyltransferase